MKHFFISFNKADKGWAEWIAWTLEEAGYSVWYQGWDFQPGNHFILLMHKALEESKQLIAVLSDDYLNSRYTAPEWAAMFLDDPRADERKLLTFRVTNCKPGGLLKGIIYTDLFGLAEDDARNALFNAVRPNRRSKISPPFPPVGEMDKRTERVASDPKRFPGPDSIVETPPPNTGRIVAVACDRKVQQRTFEEVFIANVKRYEKYPQLFVVHGRARERHQSLVARLSETIIQDFAHSLAKDASVGVWEELEWSYKSDANAATQQLIEGLLIRAHKNDPSVRFRTSTYSAAAFRAAVKPLLNPVIVVQHKIDARQWTSSTQPTLLAYLRFWDEVREDPEIPQFVIFLNVVYRRMDGSGWNLPEKWRDWRCKNQVRSALTGFNNLPGRRSEEQQPGVFCKYTLLDELTCVRLQHLEEWFETYNLGRNDVAWETNSRNIFSERGWPLDACKNMAEVETALDDFIHVMRTSSNQTTS